MCMLYKKRDACIVVHDRLCEIFLVLKLPPKYDKSIVLYCFFFNSKGYLKCYVVELSFKKFYIGFLFIMLLFIEKPINANKTEVKYFLRKYKELEIMKRTCFSRSIASEKETRV